MALNGFRWHSSWVMAITSPVRAAVAAAPWCEAGEENEWAWSGSARRTRESRERARDTAPPAEQADTPGMLLAAKLY